MVETDAERGEEPWSLEDLKQSAKLTEEAMRWKGLGEDAVQQRNKLITDLRADPMTVLYNIENAMTQNPQQARAWLVSHVTALVNQNIAYEEMDPRDRENMELKRQSQDLQERLRKQEASDVQTEEHRRAQETFEQSHNEIVTALTALGYEAEDEVVQTVANVLDQAHTAGHTHITASKAAQMVLKELEEQTEENWTNFDPAKAPPEVLEKFRAFEVEQLRGKQKPVTPPASQTPDGTGRRRSRRAAGIF